MKEYIVSMPAVGQVVRELIRCRDCKWWESGLCENDYVAQKIKDCGCYPDFRTDSDWFCADGERR